MTIPTEAVPSLLGQGGSKVRDISKVYGSKISIIKQNDVLSFINIENKCAQSVVKTKTLIEMAVKHYFSATEDLTKLERLSKVPDMADADLDAKVFWAETLSRSQC